MATAKMTLIGLYRWDDSLFNDMVLPAGIDKDLLVDSLLMRGGEFEVLYADPDFMKMSIGVWSKKWYRTFAEWLRGTQATWNPIYNYDRYEDGRDEGRKKFDSLVSTDYTDTRTADLQEKRSANLQDKRTADLKEKRTADLQDKRSANLKEERTPDLNEQTTFNNADTTTQMSDGTTEHKVAAYDSSSYSPSSKDIINNGDSKVSHDGTVTNATTGSDATKTTGTDTMNHTGTDTTEHTGTDTTAHTGTDTTNHTGTDTVEHKGTLSDTGGSEQNSNIHSAHMYGNIGVTTSAAMLREFYDISTWNLYEHIADIFTGELLIPVY